MDRYVRVRKIGEGSFGKALLVKKKNDGKHYVIKEINISRMKPREREDSKKEVKVLSQLKHPNIVSYKESFEETGNLYIVMDYCDGGDLYKKINGQRGVMFPEEQVMDWFVQIALGLKHVHDRKILHRDIKSQNIFLTRNGMVKLGDFGIARVLHNTMELARTCIGTPYYLSPEIVENRPYNNKSDIWSLGCVLYEMLTLKHAFEAGNMKNLVLKIIRGSYPPVPIRYSGEIRLLVSQLLKSKPHDRPSVNNILKKNFIQKRIQKFLSEQTIEDEFSHTVLHRKPFGVQGQRPLPARPAQVKPAPAAPKITEPKAKYSVSVSRKKPPRKPRSGGEVAKKPVKPLAANAKPADRKVEVDARERRRRELINQQDQQYNDYMKKVQQQRWERQQKEQINKAREQAWKNTMSVGLSPDKGHAAANQKAIVNKDPQPMQKYKRPLSAVEQKENIPEQVPKPVRPASANPNANPALEAERQGQINRVYGAEAAERARIKEEFWSRKRAAAMNKKRGQADYGGYEYKPPLQPKGFNGQAGNMGRNHQEEDYLSRLEAIRRQNYAERREIQKRMAGVRGPAEAPKKEDVSGDPRYDPEARRKKIAALKMQAEERAAMLRKQLDEKKKAVLERLNKAGKEKWEEEQRKVKAEEKPNRNERVFVPYRRAVPEEKPLEKPAVAVAAVGLETALKQVGIGTLYRSNSENDIPKISKEDDHVVRKQWGDIPFQPRMLPLEVTASHMEATSVNDAVIKPSDNNAARKQWGQQKTQVVSALEKIKLQTATSTIMGRDESDAAGVGQTITISKSQPSSPGIGQTITVSKETTPGGLPVVGQTMTVSPGPSGSPQTVILKKDILKTVTEEPEEIKGPTKAWEDKAISPKGASSSSTDSNNKEQETKKATSPATSPREAYEQFLKSSRNEQKPEQQPLFNKVKPKDDSPSSDKSNDLEVEDLSVDEFSFHTADGSPEKTSRTNLLRTGTYDTNSRHLRTCSMPDLRLLFATPAKDAAALEGKDDGNTEDDDEEDEDMEDNNEEENEEDNDDNNDDDDNGDDDNGDDDEFNDDEEEEELQGSPNDDEDEGEYENMLASMRDVLVSSARSPSPMKSCGTVQSMDWDPSADTESPSSVDDADGQAEGRSSELSNLNEDWDSGEGEDDDENNDDKQSKEDDDDDNSVFQRLEESRQALEQELGFDRFLRVYRYLQTIQENEDEDANVSSSSDEITELLGEKEHLYPKILYLVIADSAYSEENQ